MKKVFGVLQQIGKAFMLPIAVLPIAGVLLGIGGAFTNPTLIETYGLTFLESGTFANKVLIVFFRAGLLVFANLPLLFAVGVAIGLARKNKETAALASVLGFLLLHTIVGVVLQFQGFTPESTTLDALIQAGYSRADATGLAAMYTKELGIFTLQLGVFGGIIVGMLSAFITNRFSTQKLPEYLAFFSGTRFVPLVTMALFMPLGALLPFVWPFVFKGIVTAGTWFSAMGYIGTFFYGSFMRMLNIFGLHHAIYPLFWYTELGGTLEVAGEMISGGQRIFFAQLADPSVQHFSAEATRTMTGGFLPMMFGLPAAAIAMYKVADLGQKPLVKGILLSAALTSFLTGITEPIEFTFLFVAPPLYLIHAVLEGLSYMLMHMLNVAVGITFSRGIIDFTFFALLQGMAKTSYHWILILGPVYAVAYYYIFKFSILTFNYATPGRLGAEARLYRRVDYDAKRSGAETHGLVEKIVEALGGAANISAIDACITRLRVTVENTELVVDDEAWKGLGAQGVIKSGNGIQIIYGTKAEEYKNAIRERYKL